MKTNIMREVRELIGKYKEKGFRYTRSLDFLLPRINSTKENIEKEITELLNPWNMWKNRQETMKQDMYYFLSITERAGANMS